MLPVSTAADGPAILGTRRVMRDVIETLAPLDRTPCSAGERVYFRHAKAGELCEHLNEVHLVQGDAIVDVVPTYRGEGRLFL